jgi:hypothetical protein
MGERARDGSRTAAAAGAAMGWRIQLVAALVVTVCCAPPTMGKRAKRPAANNALWIARSRLGRLAIKLHAQTHAHAHRPARRVRNPIPSSYRRKWIASAGDQSLPAAVLTYCVSLLTSSHYHKCSALASRPGRLRSGGSSEYKHTARSATAAPTKAPVATAAAFGGRAGGWTDEAL